jgi:hypothetical protein
LVLGAARVPCISPLKIVPMKRIGISSTRRKGNSSPIKKAAIHPIVPKKTVAAVMSNRK